MPQQEEVLTIAPPPASAIKGIAALTIRKGASTFTDIDKL